MAPPSIALVAVVYAFASAAATLSVAEFIPRPDNLALKGGFSAHLGCALGAAVVGGAVAARSGSIETLVVTGIAVMVLAAAAYAGFCADGLPADIPFGALAIVLVAALAHGIYPSLWGAAFTGSPFLITALVARDKRGSLRDGAVAAIGGSILGINDGIGATILGSVIGAVTFKTTAVTAGARSFAPYIACTIGLGIVFFALFQV